MRKDYRASYAAYWDSTKERTGTGGKSTPDTPHTYLVQTADLSALLSGSSVDAVIMPVAPHAAVIPGKWQHYGEFFYSRAPC